MPLTGRVTRAGQWLLNKRRLDTASETGVTVSTGLPNGPCGGCKCLAAGERRKGPSHLRSMAQIPVPVPIMMSVSQPGILISPR